MFWLLQGAIIPLYVSSWWLLQSSESKGGFYLLSMNEYSRRVLLKRSENWCGLFLIAATIFWVGLSRNGQGTLIPFSSLPDGRSNSLIYDAKGIPFYWRSSQNLITSFSNSQRWRGSPLYELTIVRHVEIPTMMAVHSSLTSTYLLSLRSSYHEFFFLSVVFFCWSIIAQRNSIGRPLVHYPSPLLVER